MKFPYNKSVEVTTTQFNRLSKVSKGILAWRKDDKGKYFVKLLDPRYRKQLENYINQP